MAFQTRSDLEKWHKENKDGWDGIWLNGERGLEGVYEQVKIANKCFNLFNKEVQLNVCNGSHQWYGSWMDKF